MLLRVPGLGVKAVARLLQARRVRRLRSADLERLRVPLAKVLPFVELADHRPGKALDDARCIDAGPPRRARRRRRAQASLFDDRDATPGALSSPPWRRIAALLADGAGAGGSPGRAAHGHARQRDRLRRLPARLPRSSGPSRSRPITSAGTAPTTPSAICSTPIRKPLGCRRRSQAARSRRSACRRRSCRSRESVVLHRDPDRFGAALPAALALARSSPALRADPLDPDWLRADEMAQAVRRDMHKMKAFVRFRTIADADDEPARRCTSPGSSPSTTSSRRPRRSSRAASRAMRWAILTPERSVALGRRARSGSAPARAATRRRRPMPARSSGSPTTEASSTRRG